MVKQMARRLLAFRSLLQKKQIVLLRHTCLSETTIMSGVRATHVPWRDLLEPRSICTKRSTFCSNINFDKSFSTYVSSTAEPGGIIEVPLAQTGEGIAECELLSWLVKEGEHVDEFQPLCSVQSDKATIQITSRFKGKVSRLNFLPGDVIKVGESLLELISTSSVQSPANDEVFSSSIQFSANEEDSDTESDVSAQDDEHAEKGNRRALATPAVRQLARSHGIQLEAVSGSGKDGRVLKEDILKLIEFKDSLNESMRIASTLSPNEELPTAIPGEELGFTAEKRKRTIEGRMDEQMNEEDITIPVRGYQRTMVKTMTAAAAIPHFYLVDELKLDALVNLRKELQDFCAEQGVKLTYLPLMIKALSVALSKYPLVNSIYNEKESTICQRGTHNVGVAVATPFGLAVPNIKNVQRLSVMEIANELSRLTQLAAVNQLSSEDVSGGTISVSNFGSIGGKVGYPLLNVPEVAIGAFGRIHKVPCFAEDGSIIQAPLMNVTWAADHRVLDGATLVKFSNEWRKLLEQPGRLLVELR
ncbi:hypothetical protein KP509_37G043300 [Ceratopteris richardii]|nr:hypothetical protein KP509_37G043300 [Ceratopteris richardii]